MYGIKRGEEILCNTKHGRYFLKPLFAVNPVVLESATEVDQLMQVLTIALSDYSLYVYKLSREAEEELMIRKLKGT